MLKIIGIILMVGIGIMLIKLFLSFLLAFFTYTISAFICTGPILLILSIIRVLDSDTASVLFWCAMGIGFICDIGKFIAHPSKRFSDTKEIFESPWNTNAPSAPDTPNEDSKYPSSADKYRKCCGSCKWYSSSAFYDVCQLYGNEVHHTDSCGSWQPK